MFFVSVYCDVAREKVGYYVLLLVVGFSLFGGVTCERVKYV